MQELNLDQAAQVAGGGSVLGLPWNAFVVGTSNVFYAVTGQKKAKYIGADLSVYTRSW